MFAKKWQYPSFWHKKPIWALQFGSCNAVVTHKILHDFPNLRLPLYGTITIFIIILNKNYQFRHHDHWGILPDFFQEYSRAGVTYDCLCCDCPCLLCLHWKLFSPLSSSSSSPMKIAWLQKLLPRMLEGRCGHFCSWLRSLLLFINAIWCYQIWSKFVTHCC